MTNEEGLKKYNKLVALIKEEMESSDMYESEMEHGDCSDWSRNFESLYAFLLRLNSIVDEKEENK